MFVAFVIDAYSRPMVGWQLASHMRTDLVLDVLGMALGYLTPTGVKNRHVLESQSEPLPAEAARAPHVDEQSRPASPIQG